MAIQFFFQDVNISLSQQKKLKACIESIFKNEGKPPPVINYVFCTDQFLLEMNQRFLKHDYYTDIISFSLSETARQIEGEIYISIDRIRENAQKLHLTLHKELHRVIFHGALHLCGYKDKSEKEKKAMTAAENKYLKSYFK